MLHVIVVIIRGMNGHFVTLTKGNLYRSECYHGMVLKWTSNNKRNDCDNENVISFLIIFYLTFGSPQYCLKTVAKKSKTRNKPNGVVSMQPGNSASKYSTEKTILFTAPLPSSSRPFHPLSRHVKDSLTLKGTAFLQIKLFLDCSGSLDWLLWTNSKSVMQGFWMIEKA